MTSDYMEKAAGTLKSDLNKPVVLIGMMGAGKSFLGQLLARTLDVLFYDSDSIVADKAGMPITDIFERFGEEKFRDVEARTLQELTEKGACVIATGGGAVKNADTLKTLLESAHVIWLNVDLETMWQRVSMNKARPLLQTENPKQVLQDLIDERRKFYEQAHIHFEPNPKNQDETLQNLIKALSDHVFADNV